MLVCMCIYICVCVCGCICSYVYVYMCLYMYVSVFLCARAHVCYVRAFMYVQNIVADIELGLIPIREPQVFVLINPSCIMIQHLCGCCSFLSF